MKPAKIFLTALSIIFFSSALFSCAGKWDDPSADYRVGEQMFYIVQSTQNEVTTFTPYAYFVTKGRQDTYTASIYFNENRMSQNNPQTNVYEIDYRRAASSAKIADINGKYYFEGTSEEDRRVVLNYTVQLTVQDVLGAMEVEDFQYSNNVVSATFTKVTNAQYYTFFYRPGTAADPVYGEWQSKYFEFSRISNDTERFSVLLSSEDLPYDEITVTPAALRLGSKNIFLVTFGESRVLKKNGESFEPVQ